MIEKLGMPYMGSKRRLAKPLVNFMLKENPRAKYFYDLFGGGGAMSFYAMQCHQIEKVFYNELNTGVVELLRDVVENGVTDKYYQWVDRETFMAHKNNNDWFGGLCKVVWSFGNDQKSYIFSKDIEDDKKLLHNVVVNECRNSLKEFNLKFGTEIRMTDGQSLFEDETMTQRRLRIMRIIKKGGERFDLERLQQLQQLQQLENMQRLQQLENMQRLTITNLSYRDVGINTPPEETIVYLDPPYTDTKEYALKIDHDELYAYIENLGYTVYLSSYVSHLPCVLELEHTSSLSASGANQVIEKLYKFRRGSSRRKKRNLEVLI